MIGRLCSSVEHKAASGIPARKVPIIIRQTVLLASSGIANPPMTKFWNEYYLPTSLQEALALLQQHNGRARVIAGGTDLLLDFQEAYQAGERPCFDALIDVTRIQGANTIQTRDNWIEIGCGVTHAQVVASPLIQSRATALAEACAVVGGPQVRNVATLIGNVAHALPAADGTLALAALGGEAQVARTSADGAPTLEWLPLAALFQGPGVSNVDPSRELISAVRFNPTGAHAASAFARVMRPQGVALPILGMAARVRVDDARALLDVAISAGPVAPVPFRALKTEQFLRGRVLDETTLVQAVELVLLEVAPRTSAHRATREYRLELLPSLLRDVLTRAVERATNS